MGRLAKRKQSDPEPLEKPVHSKKTTVRSGGKNKRPKDDKAVPGLKAKPVEKILNDEDALEEQRAAYFDDVDLEEDIEAVQDEFDLAQDADLE
jgi:hypothetical protein